MAKKGLIVPNEEVIVAEAAPAPAQKKPPTRKRKPAAKVPAKAAAKPPVKPAVKPAAKKKKKAAAPAPPAQNANGNKYAPRRTIDHIQTPYGVLLGNSPVIKEAFPNQDGALRYIEKLALPKRMTACVTFANPVKVKTSISI